VTTDKRNGTHFDTTCKNQSRHFFYVAIDSKSFYLNLDSKILELTVLPPPVPEKVLPRIEKKGNPQSDDGYTYIAE
jgi:hypothetical protein